MGFSQLAAAVAGGDADGDGVGEADGFADALADGLADGLVEGLAAAVGGRQIKVSWPYLQRRMVGAEPLGRFLRTDFLDVGHVAGDAALDHELAVDLHLGKQLLDLDREVLAILCRVLFLDRDPRPAQVLVEGIAEQHEEGDAHHQKGAP